MPFTDNKAPATGPENKNDAVSGSRIAVSASGADLSHIDLSKFELAKSAPSSENAEVKPAKKKKPVQSRCEDCEFYDTDDDGLYYCSVSLDEDEMAEFMAGRTGRCPYYRYYNEYKSVQKQN